MTGNDLTNVPGREHYSREYLRHRRVFSYAHQIDSVLSFQPKVIVEIGVGAGMVTAAIRSVGVDVTTVDVQPDLGPDVIGSVTDLPFEEGQFDVALCCQVLEHLPFNYFVPALKELRRATTTGLVISLPDVSRYHYVGFRLPKIGERRFEWELPRIRPKAVPQRAFAVNGHYWEIGYKGYALSRILDLMAETGWLVDRTWRVPELQWHRFFRCVPS